MTNKVYGKARQKFLNGAIDMAADDIKAVLIDTNDYTVAIDEDEFLDDIPTEARIATSGNLDNKSTLLGVFGADSVTFLTVTGDELEALVIYKDTGDAETSPVIAYLDSAASGLPLTPNGGDIIIGWDTGVNKIFKL
jgi:hypothetical protein